jgi:serine protease inhibitor
MDVGVAAADAALGADLYRVLAGGGNQVFSPASIAAALRMALCGARGQTAAEIAAALRLRDGETAAGGLRLLSAGLAELAGDGVVFRAPNTMWVQAGLPLRPEFTAALREAAAVSVRDTDFARAAGAAEREINDLVAKQTEDKITNLLPPGTLDALTKLVLVNAIYLKAAWARPFPKDATRDGPFYPAGPGAGAPLTARMMRLTGNLGYLRGGGWQAVVLPYRGGRLAMTIVLPDGPLGSLPPGLAGDLAGLTGRARQHRVALTMPRFRHEGEFGLVPALRRLGVGEAFAPRRADFTGITSAEELYISAVRHKAYIGVDEEGTEASAATAVAIRAMAMARPEQPVTVTVDHPFLFVITDTATGLPLFLGQLTQPNTG